MRWIDHAMIYVLIAGSYTPACLLIAPKPWGTITITVIWLAALAGIVVKLSPLRRMRRLGGAWYVLMGWAAILILPVLVPRMTPAMLALLGVGGVLYSAGALVLYQRRPNPHVELFGYHEVWHAFVVVASLCHFAMHWIMVTTPSA